MERAALLQYDPAEGVGIVSAGGRQFPFGRDQWKGTQAPVMNRPVEADIRDGALVALAEVSEDELYRERKEQLKEDLGKYGKQASGKGADVFRKVVAVVGVPAVVAQVAFAFSAFLLPVATINVMVFHRSATIYKVLTNPVLGSESFAIYLLVAACFAILAPVLVHHKRAWLALFLPFVFVVVISLGAYSKYSNAVDTVRSSAEAIFGASAQAEQQIDEQVSSFAFRDMFQMGSGFIGMLLSSLYLAWQGFRKHLVHN